MRFEWDERKAATNLAKHNVSFEEAGTVFGDPLAETYDDPAHSTDENRFLTIGHSEQGKLLFLSHVDFDESVRLISAREATRSERGFYERRND